MTARRLWLVAVFAAALAMLAGLCLWRYIEQHRPRAAPAGSGFAAAGTQRLLTGLIFRDCGLAPSPDGRYLVVAVRQRDTTGDSRITVRDAKTMLLLDRDGETTVLCAGQLVWQDKPVRWSADGKMVALALPGMAPGWTHYDPTDLVVYDPAARRERRRYAHGINPLWLADGRLAFQRDNSICVANGDAVAELPPPPEAQGSKYLRSFIADPWRRRIIAAYSGVADVRRRDAATLTEGKQSLLFAWSETATGWQAQRLPVEGYAPRPAADGLYYYARRGDDSGNGTYELAQDGVNLMRDGSMVVEDVAFNSFIDQPGWRAVLLRRAGRFDLVELDDAGRVANMVVKGLYRHGATWVARGCGRTIISAVTEANSRGPALYELPAGLPQHVMVPGRQVASPHPQRAATTLVKLADGPVTQPFITARGIYCIRAAGESPGELLLLP